MLLCQNIVIFFIIFDSGLFLEKHSESSYRTNAEIFYPFGVKGHYGGTIVRNNPVFLVNM